MSYNRGFRRADDRGPYRSHIGQLIGQRPMTNVSPWECGVVPNAGMSSSGMGSGIGSGMGSGLQSLLPMPQAQNNSQTNMLQQQQHAIVMASNLLTNLGLLNQQQQQPQQQLPSLINIPSLNTMGNSRQYRLNPTYEQGQTRYNPMSMGVMRRKPLDSHRVDPYKPRPRPTQSLPQGQPQGRRPLQGKFVPDRKVLPGGPRAVSNKSKVQASNDLRLKIQKGIGKFGAEAKGLEVAKSAVKKPVTAPAPLAAKDVAVVDDAKRPEEEDNDGKKRDWKDEKKPDEAMEVDEKKTEDEATVENTEASAVGDEDTPTIEASEVIEGAVDKDEGDAIPEKLTTDKKFSCHVCNKFMWNEQSLREHIAAKFHKNAMVKLDASYKAQVEALRLVMREAVREQEVDLERQRGGAYCKKMFRDYCKMCDLKFVGSIANHRKNEMHLKLKTFLHPRCVICNKEFPTRLEWDTHKLSVAHQTRKRLKDMKSIVNGEKASAAGVHSIHSGPVSETKKCILDPENTSMFYDPLLHTGLQYLKVGQHCSLCQLFFEQRLDAKAHCRTQLHFDNYQAAKAKELSAQEVVSEPAEETEVVVVKQEAEDGAKDVAAAETTPPQDGDDVTIVGGKDGPDDNEGNWKRRRVATEEEDDDESEVIVSDPSPKKTPDMLDIADTPTKPITLDGDKPYDPLLADEEAKTDSDPLDANAISGAVLDDSVMEDLDREIGDILESSGVSQSEGDKDVELEGDDDDIQIIKPNATPRGPRGRRGGKGRKRGK